MEGCKWYVIIKTNIPILSKYMLINIYRQKTKNLEIYFVLLHSAIIKGKQILHNISGTVGKGQL